MPTSCLDLLARRRNADDDTLAPSLVARFQGSTHHVDVAGAVEGIVAPTVRHLDQLVGDAGPLGQPGRVDEVRGAEVLAPLLLGRVQVYDDDPTGLLREGPLDHAQAYASRAEHGNARSGLDIRGGPGRPVPRGDATAQKTCLFRRRILLDRHDRDVGHHGVLREGRGAHIVQEIFSSAPEASRPIRHEASALRGADLAAKIRLA